MSSTDCPTRFHLGVAVYRDGRKTVAVRVGVGHEEAENAARGEHAHFSTEHPLLLPQPLRQAGFVGQFQFLGD